MDGNGRWAQRRHRPRTFGHRAGVQAVKRSVRFCLEHRIPVLTLFAFSSENWQRPESEVSSLMGLFLRALEREVEELASNGVRLNFIGDTRAFSPELQERMQGAERRTREQRALRLNVAMNYGGRWDIVQAARRLAFQAQSGALDPATIDAARFEAELSLNDTPAPDLFIRTGGDFRISNFLLWHLAYCELQFTDVLWPDFDVPHLEHAVREFAGRERRYGRTSAQVAQGGAHHA